MRSMLSGEAAALLVILSLSRRWNLGTPASRFHAVGRPPVVSKRGLAELAESERQVRLTLSIRGMKVQGLVVCQLKV